MMVFRRALLTTSAAILASVAIGCMTTRPQSIRVTTAPEPEPEPEIVGVSIVVKPKDERIIPKGSRIVIAEITGQCSAEVNDALMRRLIDNPDYDVLTRENLDQIIAETNMTYDREARFDTETAAKVGELLGASLFIVGQVAYCGVMQSPPPDLGVDADSEEKTYVVAAALQILDLQSGKVIVSSASEGRYIPGPTRLLISTDPGIDPQPASNAEEPASEDAQDQQSAAPKRPKIKSVKNVIEVGNYPRIKAAEDLANSFADRFFSRPSWEVVEMWQDPRWKYSDSIRYVKLGHCPEAISFLDRVASEQLRFMAEIDVAKYLHNYGVALMCANRIDAALRKLRSAYRVAYDETTLKMLALAGRIMEWSLEVEVDEEPEVGMLLSRQMSSQ